MANEGMIGLSAGQLQPTLTSAGRINFWLCGKTLRVAESQMNALTAVSGSGPAFLFRIAEAQLAAAKIRLQSG